jgi:hypothetical protein
MILESLLISGTNTDVLNGGRLNAIPYSGVLTLQFLADLGAAANNYSLTVQLPNGDVPIDGQLVPASASAAVGLLNDRELLQVSFRATQGGHYTVSLTETGTATCMVRAILKP